MKTPSRQSNDHSQPSKSFRFVRWACTVVIALYAYGAMYPSATAWGFHHLGFFPTVVVLIALATMLFLTSARGQTVVTSFFRYASEKKLFLQLSSPFFFLLLAFCAALFWFLRERIFFLGDGYLVERSLVNVSQLNEVVLAFRNEPFAGWLIWHLYHLLSWLQVTAANELAFSLLSTLCGLAFIVVIVRLARLMSSSKLDQVLLSAFVLASGSLQLFFGYVELYAPAILGLALYLTLSLRYLQSKTSLLYPSLAFGALASLHLGMLSLAPSLLYLVTLEFRQHRIVRAVVSGGASALIFIALIFVSGYSPTTFWANLTGGEKQHFLAVTMTGSFWQPYTLFSLWHFLDFANLLFLVSPFAFVLIAALARRHQWNNPPSLFFGIAALSGLVFVFAVNPDLGMSRDWDLLGTFILPSIVLAVFLWVKNAEQTPALRPLMATLVGITVIHTGFWVALNANEARSLERFTTLPDERLWGKGARANAYDELGVYFRARKNYTRALEYWERYLAIDSKNARIWTSLGYLYRATSDVEREIQAWENALQYGANSAAIYGDLGTLYIQQHQLEKGYALTTKALERFPNSAKALNNMGVILAQQGKNCAETLPYFLQAIRSDSTFPEGYLNAGLCYQMMNEKQEMKTCWERFLELTPDAPQAGQVRVLLAKIQ